MTHRGITLLLVAGLLGAPAGAAAGPTTTQASHYTPAAVEVGPGGYRLNFSVTWACDDAPQGTASAPGQIDLIDANGVLAARLSGSVGNGLPLIQLQGGGSTAEVEASVQQLGAGGTPANGILTGTWLITGLNAGAYTARYWYYQEAVTGFPASTITTQAADTGGSGPISPAPSPTPPPPPTVSLAAPVAAVALAPTSLSAVASVQPGGHPLASVVIAASVDNGATWMPVAADSHPASPADSEAATYSFGQAGPAAVRATATDISGLSASAEQWVTVARAGQPPLGLSPAAASIVAGQSVSFSASGGATGNYSWSGAAAGTGPSQAVSFPMSGTFTVSVVDAGNSTFNPSLPAVATVTVQAPFYTLSVAATAGGTAAGGGSYPPNAQATAVAAPAPGSAFTGWTGDQAGSTPTLLVLMNASKSLVAHFAPLLAQTITFTAPGAVSTRTPAFGLVATASSGLPVSFALDAGPATLASTTLTPSGAVGEVTVTAMQPGNGQFMAAPPVTVSFAVGNPPPGVVLLDDSAETKRSDRETRTTSFRSGPAE